MHRILRPYFEPFKDVQEDWATIESLNHLVPIMICYTILFLGYTPLC